MKNKFSQKNTLRLKLIPYLAFRAKMLEMDIQNLNEFVLNLLETNPFVEEDPVAPAADIDWKVAVSDGEDMYDSLIHQFRMLEVDEDEKKAGEYIIHSLTKDGYFTMPIEEVARNLNISVKSVENALKKVQSLEPPGIAARNLPECFILQLENEAPLSPKIKHVITEHLEELAEEQYSKLSKTTGLTRSTLEKLREKIMHLTAAPGFAFQKEKIRNIVPDLVIKKIDGKFVVELNKKFRRKFHLNKKYIELLKRDEDKEEILKELADKARWAEETIQERDALLFGIGKFIAENEKDFLNGESAYPSKYSADEIAGFLEKDTSTVSRIVQNKYVETPVGIFPLHFFIQRKGRNFNDEELKIKIKEIIKTEDKRKPLSDEEIAKLLCENGIKVKRRTVVKYRKKLGIPASSKRKKID